MKTAHRHHSFRAGHICCVEKQVCRGYTQSLRPEQLGLALQVDMAVTAFLEPGPVKDYLVRAAGLRDPRDFARATPMQIRKASKAIAGIKVTPLHHASVCT